MNCVKRIAALLMLVSCIGTAGAEEGRMDGNVLWNSRLSVQARITEAVRFRSSDGVADVQAPILVPVVQYRLWDTKTRSSVFTLEIEMSEGGDAVLRSMNMYAVDDATLTLRVAFPPDACVTLEVYRRHARLGRITIAGNGDCIISGDAHAEDDAMQSDIQGLARMMGGRVESIWDSIGWMPLSAPSAHSWGERWKIRSVE